MIPEEKTIEQHLEEIKAKKVKGGKRVILFTTIPIVVCLIVLGFSAWGAVEFEWRKDKAIQELADTEQKKKDAESDLIIAKESFNSFKASVEEFKTSLEESKNCNDKETLIKEIDNIEKPVSQESPTPKESEKTNKDRNTDKKTPVETNIPKKYTGGRTWIVVSGDKPFDQAKFEVQRVQNLGYKNVAIYLQGNFYRTIIDFSSETEARAKFPEILRVYSDAYLRYPNKWCPDPKKLDGYFQCFGK
jgi:hypothetical protein